MASYTITGEVDGDAAGINNVRGRIVSQVRSAGEVDGAGSVAGFVTVTVDGLVAGAGAVTGAVRNTPRVFGEVDGAGSVAGAVVATAKFPRVVSGAASITGVPQRSLIGTVTGTGSVTGTVRPDVSIAGLVRGFQAVTGALRGAKTVAGTVSGAASVTAAALRLGIRVAGSVSRPAALTAGYIIHAKVTSATVLGTGAVSGAIVRAQPAVGSAEGGYEATGVRPGLPLLVYHLDAYAAADVADVPAGGSFLVAPAYVGASGDPFFEAGAGADSIGTKIQPAVGSAFYVFRSPLADEVVWYVGGEQTYRYHLDRSTGVSRWGKYRTQPQRTADGMYLFSIFDPDGIYTYYAKLLGAVQYQLSYDNQVLLQQFDPDVVSRFYISELATNYGLVLDDTDTLAVKRAKTRNAVSVAKLKGLGEAVSIRLRALGYSGYANEIWVNPTNVANFQSAALNDNGTPTSTATGAGTDYVEYPHGYRVDDPEDGYFPSSRISLHVNAAGGGPLDITPELMDRIATELGRDVLPVHVDIRCFATDFSVGGASSDGDEGIAVGETLTAHDVSASDVPVVYAGADFTQHAPADAYTIGDATATDPGSMTLTYAWTVVSGPGGSTFDNATLLHPTITFHGNLGTYVLRLTATNGLATAHDDVQVVAAAALAPNALITLFPGPAASELVTTVDFSSFARAQVAPTASWVDALSAGYANGHFFLGDNNGSRLWSSPDGTTWTQLANVPFGSPYGYAYGAGTLVVGSNIGYLSTSPDMGATWTHTIDPSGAGITKGLIFYSGFFMSLAAFGGPQYSNTMRSADGITWQTPVSVSPAPGSDICLTIGVLHGNIIAITANSGTGLCYVAVSTDLAATFSYATNSWATLGGAEPTAAWVEDGVGVMVAGPAGTMFSADGFTWATPVNPGFSRAVNSVIYYGGAWYMTLESTSSPQLAKSTNNGASWTTVSEVVATVAMRVMAKRTTTVSTTIPRFVAIDSYAGSPFGDLNIAATTAVNGKGTWALVTGVFGSGVAVSGGEYVNGHWLFGSNVGNAFGPDAVISTDLVTFTPIHPLVTSGEQFNSFGYFFGMYFAYGSQGHYATSVDGLTWTQRTSPIAGNVRWMASDGTTLVAVGERVSNETHFFWSTDGISWTEAATDAGSFGFGIPKVKYANGIFMAVGYTGGHANMWVFTSTDGRSWTSQTTGFGSSDGLNCLAYGAGIWLVGGPSTGGYMWTSANNGVSWNRFVGPPNGTQYDLIFKNGLFLCVCADGLVYTSPNGTTWDAGTSLARAGNPTGRIIAGP